MSFWEIIAILVGFWLALSAAFVAGAWCAARKRVTDQDQTVLIERAYEYGRSDERKEWEQWQSDVHEGDRPTRQTPQWIRRSLDQR